jgi:hypothetical protein
MKSLQSIEDYYKQRELRGTALRKALERDKEYQKILAARRQKLTQKFLVSPEEKGKYILSTDTDYKILGKIHRLEKLKLQKEDRKIVKFIRSQLELEWRCPLVRFLDKLLRKYK